MKRLILLTLACTLALTGVAQAHGFPAGRALAGARVLARASDVQASCPAGVPVQAITVVNEANVRPWALAKVENAAVAQSLQLRAAWGTPCVVFAAGGWPLVLRVGGTTSGVHYSGDSPDGPPAPNAIVYTGGFNYNGWSQDFSHETVEMLVDPVDTDYTLSSESYQLEIADPVEQHGYRLDGVNVADFTFPAYFAGATYLVGAQPGTEIAPAGAPGPYDAMGVLTASWQTAS